MVTWRMIRDVPQKVIGHLQYLREKTSEMDYMSIRGRTFGLFSSLNVTPYDGVVKLSQEGQFAELAAHVIYLSKTGFNGLWRVNSQNKPNVPWGKYKKPVVLDEAAILSASQALKGAEIRYGDFEGVLDECGDGDLVYLDPPYWGDFDQYTAEGFTNEDQLRLIRAAERAAGRGAQVLISNVDETATRELYEGHGIQVLEDVDSVSATTEGRGIRRDLLVHVNRPITELEGLLMDLGVNPPPPVSEKDERLAMIEEGRVAAQAIGWEQVDDDGALDERLHPAVRLYWVHPPSGTEVHVARDDQGYAAVNMAERNASDTVPLSGLVEQLRNVALNTAVMRNPLNPAEPKLPHVLPADTSPSTAGAAIGTELIQTEQPRPRSPKKPKEAPRMAKPRKAAPYPYVAEVKSNVKGQITATLGPKVLIIGPNGSQKSAIPNSIELALGGFITDIAGRARLSRGQDIIETAANGTSRLEATVQTSDGRTRTVSWVRKGSKVSAEEPVGDTIPVRFLIDEIEEHLLGSPESARRYLLRAAAGTLVRADILRRLDPTLHADYISAANAQTAGVNGTPDEVALLSAVRDAFASEAKRASEEADAAQAVIGRLSANLPPLPTEAQVEEAEREATEAQQRLADLRAQARPVDLPFDAVNTSNQQVTAAHNRVAQATYARDVHTQVIQHHIAHRPPEPETATPPDIDVEWINALTQVVARHAPGPDHPGLCLVCGTGWTGEREQWLQGLAGQLINVRQLLDAQAQAAEAQLAYDTWVQTAHAHLRRLEELEADVQAAQANFLAVQAAHQALVASVPSTQGASHEDLQAAATAAAEASDAARRYRETITRWDQITQARQDVTAQRQAASRAAMMRDALAGVVAELVDASISAFKQRVQAYLPTTDVFDIRLTDSVVRFGFVRNGALHTALSGAEWARLTMALAGALCEPAPGKEPDLKTIPIIIPRERAYDARTQRAIMQALTHVPCQVIITHPTGPVGRVPKGWTVIDQSGNVSNTGDGEGDGEGEGEGGADE